MPIVLARQLEMSPKTMLSFTAVRGNTLRDLTEVSSEKPLLPNAYEFILSCPTLYAQNDVSLCALLKSIGMLKSSGPWPVTPCPNRNLPSGKPYA